MSIFFRTTFSSVNKIKSILSIAIFLIISVSIFSNQVIAESSSSSSMNTIKSNLSSLNDVSYWYVFGLVFFTFASIVMAGLYIYLNNLYFKNLLNKYFDWVSVKFGKAGEL